MKKRAKQAGAVATVTLFGVFTRLIAFLFKVYLSRVLGPEALGLYQIALSVFLLFASLSSSGVPLILSRKVAEADALGKKNDFSVFTTALIYSTSLSVVIVIMLITMGERLDFLFSDPLACPVFLIMAPALISTAVYCVIRGWFWGKKMFAAFSFTETLEECLRILFGILFLGGIFGVIGGATVIAYSFTVSDIIVAIVLMCIFFIKGGALQKPAPLKGIFMPALPVTAMRLSASIFATLLAIILPAELIQIGMTATEATEAFGRITGMANPLLFVPGTVTGSIAVVLLPDISALAVKKEFEVLNKRLSFGVNFSVLVCGLFIGLYAALGEKITAFLYGDELSGKYLSFATISMLPMCLSQMSQSVLNSIGKEKQAFVSYLTGNVAMLALIAVLPRYLGVYSVAVATTVSFAIDASMNCFFLHKATGWGRSTVRYVAFSSFFALLTAILTKSFLPILADLPAFVSLALASCLGLCAYLLLTFAAELIDVNGFLSVCKKKSRLPIRRRLKKIT